MNLNPEIWGPHAWFFLESIIIGMPEELDDTEKEIYKNFFNSLQFLLPCKKCRLHYAINLEENPLTDDVVGTRDAMFKWINKLHNEVRTRNGKQTKTVSETMNYYKSTYNNNENKSDFKSCYIAIFFGILILFFIYSRTI